LGIAASFQAPCGIGDGLGGVAFGKIRRRQLDQRFHRRIGDIRSSNAIALRRSACSIANATPYKDRARLAAAQADCRRRDRRSRGIPSFRERSDLAKEAGVESDDRS